MKQLLWTIQHEEAYREFEKTGILVANDNCLFCGEDLRFAYDWLSDQMRKRIGPPPLITKNGHRIGVRFPCYFSKLSSRVTR